SNVRPTTIWWAMIENGSSKDVTSSKNVMASRIRSAHLQRHSSNAFFFKFGRGRTDVMAGAEQMRIHG
ncbi:hypothetical protein ACLOJK_027166, partial [Asimina triloba]